MNLNGLTRHYDQLTAWERLPLILAALNRGDAAEEERLTGSAPTRPAKVPHYYSLWEGLTLLTVAHQMLQLERVCRLFSATALLVAGKVKGEEKLRMLAYQFIVEAEGWKLFSAELHIDPDAILRHLPGCDLVRDMEEAARKMAFSPEEALAYLRSQVEAGEAAADQAPARQRECRLDTPDDVARGMREFLAGRAARWL
jgi:hypothetical protein